MDGVRTLPIIECPIVVDALSRPIPCSVLSDCPGAMSKFPRSAQVQVEPVIALADNRNDSRNKSINRYFWSLVIAVVALTVINTVWGVVNYYKGFRVLNIHEEQCR